MKLCEECNENIAVIFISKIEDGKRVQKGLCVECAKKLGIEPLKHMMNQSGMSDGDLDNINKQMAELMSNMDFDDMALPNNEGEDLDLDSNPIIQLMKAKNEAPDEDSNEKSDEVPNDAPKEKSSKGKLFTKTREQKKANKRKFLDTFGTNLTKKAKNDEIDRVIGRQKEIDRTIQILNRRTKNNPCLIGEPGVGKTAIAEGLAVRISNKEVPAKMLNAEVYQIDMAGMVAGTQFRGQFEARLKGLMKEAKTLGNIILVIDELHSIVGAGDAEGSMNAANILKPSLAKGEVQIIGATTIKEYRKYIEKDSALERRFQPITVEEPSVEETIEILIGIKDYYEKHHSVHFSDRIIESAVLLSERYINDRFLPDKAIDVIDEAASKVNLRNKKLIKLQLLKNELFSVLNDKTKAASTDKMEDYQKAAELKARECQLKKSIAEYENSDITLDVEFSDIADIIEAWTNIPVQRITEVEAEKLLNLETRLDKRIVGQDDAIHAVAKAMRRSRSGLRPRRRPASFIFVGPTGVGKTELVKALANEMFETEDSIIRLDMSEFMEKHSSSKLIGSPPGYVGYDEEGQLTEKVRRNPYSIILMDEIEKAHADIFNLLLQILEDGRLTDSHGRVVNFENTILIMTSNSGNSFKANGFGFGEDSYELLESHIKDSLKNLFRPEFLNRVDDIIVFTKLSDVQLKEVTLLLVEEFKKELKEKKIFLDISDSAIDYIIDKECDDKFGARPLRRGVQKHVEDILSEMYIKQSLKDNSKVLVDCEDNKLNYKVLGTID